MMSKKQWVMGGVGVMLVLGSVAGVWYYATKIHVPAFAISSNDTITSWTYKGPYTGNAALTTQANADIAHLTGLMGKGQYDDYDLYIGIGNDNDLMGNGSSAYDAYNHAINIHPQKGLAYVDLAHFMGELGATHTAADAYTKAVAVEPTVLEYHIERLDYLTRTFPNDNALLTAAFTDASHQFGDTAAILSIEAEWLTGQGRITDAIKAWQTVKKLSPANRQASIDAEIARLQKKL